MIGSKRAIDLLRFNFLFIFLLTLNILASDGTVLKMGMAIEPNTLNPAFRGSTEEGIINALMVRSAAHFNTDSELVPHLALRAPKWVKNNLEFEIRDNAKWDDGTPVTCADFQTTLLSQQKFRGTSPTSVQKVEWPPAQPRKCSILFGVKRHVYTLYMTPPLPTHIEKPIIEKSTDEVDYPKNSIYAKDPTRKGLVNGPYRMTVYKPGYYFELERNRDFYGKAPPFDKIQIRFYKSMQALLNAYYSQEVDTILNGLTKNRVDEIQKMISSKSLTGKTISRPSTKLIHLEFNTQRKSVADARVRHALAHLISPKDLEQVLDGDGTLTGSLPFPNDPLYVKEYEKPRFSWNLKKATELLQTAGYSRNSSGQWVNKNSEQLEIIL